MSESPKSNEAEIISRELEVQFEDGFVVGELPRIEALSENPELRSLYTSVREATARANKKLAEKFAASSEFEEWLGIGA